MSALVYLCNFLAGAFLVNSIPHTVSALQGMPFPTPFAKPRGEGDSPPWLNFVWGFANALFGVYLIWLCPIAFEPGAHLGVALIGAFLMGLFMSRHSDGFKRKTPVTRR